MTAISAEYVRNRFFRGFIVALARAGVEQIEAADAAHQRRFERVAQQLRDRVRFHPCTDRIVPHYLSRSPITGHYTDFDDALVAFQHSLLGLDDPYRSTIRMIGSPALFEAIEKQFSPEENALLNELAVVYRDSAEKQYAEV